MKAIISVTVILIVMTIAIIASLTLLNVLSVDQGMDYAIKIAGSMAILGIASGLIALFAGSSAKDNKQ